MHGHFWMPIDDHNCWAWTYDFHPTRALTKPRSAPRWRPARACTANTCPARYRPLANKDNDYLMDRAAQKAGKTYSGVEGFAIQDSSLQESMGPICDRTKENLVSTDNGIIMARHRMLRAAKALPGQGHAAARRRSRAPQDPLGLDRAAAGSGVQGRRQGSAHRRRLGVAQTTV